MKTHEPMDYHLTPQTAKRLHALYVHPLYATVDLHHTVHHTAVNDCTTDIPGHDSCVSPSQRDQKLFTSVLGLVSNPPSHLVCAHLLIVVVLYHTSEDHTHTHMAAQPADKRPSIISW